MRGSTGEDALKNILEAVELYLEPAEEDIRFRLVGDARLFYPIL